MKAIDNQTIQFVLKAPSGSLPFAFTVLPGMIASPTAIRAEGDSFGRNPVGAGPFKLQEWAQNDHMTMVKNASYWNKSKPHFDRLTFRVIPDGQVRGQSLLSGAIQITGTNSTTLVTLQPRAREFRLLGVGSSNTRPDTISQALNGAAGGPALVSQMEHLPGSNIDFRHALALAFSEPVTSKVLLHGLWTTRSTLTCAPFAKSSPVCVAGIWPKTNIEEASRLIQKYLAAGGPKTVTFLSTNSHAAIDDPYTIQVLNAIGLSVKTNSLQGSAYIQKLVAGDFDIAYTAFNTAGSLYPVVFNTLHSSAQNIPKQHILALDNALVIARDAPTIEKQKAAYQQVQRIIGRQYMFAFYEPQPVGWAFNSSTLDPGDQSPGTALHWEDFSLKQ